MNYKINKALFNSDGSITVSTEQIKELIKNNPELLEDTKVSGRYFFPEVKETYWYINNNGDVALSINAGNYFNKIPIGLGVFKTKEDAELARDKQKAIVACWKWSQENAPFEPDWENEDERKYCVYYYSNSKELTPNLRYNSKEQFTLPYFKSEEDCERFIEANKANLELLFTK